MNIYSVNGSAIEAEGQGQAGHKYCDARPEYVGPLKIKLVRANVRQIIKFPQVLRGRELIGSAYSLSRRVSVPI